MYVEMKVHNFMMKLLITLYVCGGYLIIVLFIFVMKSLIPLLVCGDVS